MRHILITAFLLPVAAFSQHHIRVLHPAEICPEESYAFFRPFSFSTDPITGGCACMACVVINSTGEYVQVRLSCEDCNALRTGDTLWLEVVPEVVPDDSMNPRIEQP